MPRDDTCWRFAANGWCNYGSRCRFRHDDDAVGGYHSDGADGGYYSDDNQWSYHGDMEDDYYSGDERYVNKSGCSYVGRRASCCIMFSHLSKNIRGVAMGGERYVADRLCSGWRASCCMRQRNIVLGKERLACIFQYKCIRIHRRHMSYVYMVVRLVLIAFVTHRTVVPIIVRSWTRD